jgi:hypothetical protein
MCPVSFRPINNTVSKLGKIPLEEDEVLLDIMLELEFLIAFFSIKSRNLLKRCVWFFIY